MKTQTETFKFNYQGQILESFDDFLDSYFEIPMIVEAPVRKKSNNGLGPVMTKGPYSDKKTKKQKPKSSGILPASLASLAMAYGATSYLGTHADKHDAKNHKPSYKHSREVKLYGLDGNEIGAKKAKPKKSKDHDGIESDGTPVSPLAKDNPDKKPFYKIGSPYQKYGITYTPKYDPSYSKVGVASWYGPGFHGRLTANHDVFDTNTMTAAHPTLPIPSRVWVTNMENGKKVLVTVNDRGPYAKDRIIDLSNKAASALGFDGAGTAKVKVQYDQAETEKYLKNKGLYDQYIKLTQK